MGLFLIFVFSIAIGFFLPRYRTVLLAVAIPVVYLFWNLEVLGTGPDSDWVWLMLRETTIAAVALFLGTLLGGSRAKTKDVQRYG